MRFMIIRKADTNAELEIRQVFERDDFAEALKPGIREREARMRAATGRSSS